IIPTSSGTINPFRQISRVETTTTDTWKGVTGEGPKARYRAEGTEADEGEVKLAQPEIKMESADWWEPAAYELGQDWSGLEPQLAGMLQRAKDELEADAFLTGTGEDEPYGLLTDATETVETAAKDLFTVEDLEALEDDLPDGFLANASFLGHRLTLKRVRGFTVEGAPIWVKVPGELPEINGLPAHELSSMAATVKGGDLILAFGDFNYFLIVDRLGMSIRFAEQFGENRLPTGQMGVLALWRNGSKVLSKKAFRVLKVKAA
ncbi:MAG TPA: phage major capsid protein, partial [Solirubrobacterales bacterium]|nr:phage major capsid protein [Solirubrobacterales bacterium]